MIFLFRAIFNFITYGVTAIVVAAIVLIVLRSLFNYMDVNPFKWSARTVRRVTDPVIMSMRRTLASFRVDPQLAPFIAVLIIILAGYLAVLIAEGFLNILAGIVDALASHAPGAAVAIIGYLIFGLLGLYTLLIFVRIIFSWGNVEYSNRKMRFLIRVTEPLLGPLRRSLPTAGRMDISPIVAALIIWLLQQVVAGTLLRGWRLQFF